MLSKPQAQKKQFNNDKVRQRYHLEKNFAKGFYNDYRQALPNQISDKQKHCLEIFQQMYDEKIEENVLKQLKTKKKEDCDQQEFQYLFDELKKKGISLAAKDYKKQKNKQFFEYILEDYDGIFKNKHVKGKYTLLSPTKYKNLKNRFKQTLEDRKEQLEEDERKKKVIYNLNEQNLQQAKPQKIEENETQNNIASPPQKVFNINNNNNFEENEIQNKIALQPQNVYDINNNSNVEENEIQNKTALQPQNVYDLNNNSNVEENELGLADFTNENQPLDNKKIEFLQGKKSMPEASQHQTSNMAIEQTHGVLQKQQIEQEKTQSPQECDVEKPEKYKKESNQTQLINYDTLSTQDKMDDEDDIELYQCYSSYRQFEEQDDSSGQEDLSKFL